MFKYLPFIEKGDSLDKRFQMLDEIKEKLEKFKISEDNYKEHFNKLVSLKFTETEANNIILRQSSRNTIRAVIEHTPFLLDKYKCDFTHQQIVRIATCKGGFKNVQTVSANHEKLKGKFTPEQITRIAAKDGDSKNIEAVSQNFNALKIKGFSNKQIIKIMACIGGGLNIEGIIRFYDELINLNYSIFDYCDSNGKLRL